MMFIPGALSLIFFFVWFILWLGETEKPLRFGLLCLSGFMAITAILIGVFE